jgi:diguanylate cyclase (GGDEF)-like protein
MIGRNAADLVLASDAPRAAEAHRQALRDPGSTKTVEYRAYTASGDLRWFETHTRAVVDDDGVVTGVVSAVRDVGHRKRVEEQLEQAARTDKLTGLANRHAFDEKLELMITHAQDGGGGCVALFDLDHFKLINDGHGHAAGDAVLVRFAEIARGRMRDNDLIARYGGEEFAVILPGASLEQARLVCDRLRAAVGDAIVTIDGQDISVTVSGGVTRYDGISLAPAVMAEADAALYEAKLGGRDRMAIAA